MEPAERSQMHTKLTLRFRYAADTVVVSIVVAQARNDFKLQFAVCFFLQRNKYK